MKNIKQQKTASLIQREISSIFQQEMSHHFYGQLITITGVEISPDQKTATIFLSILPEPEVVKTMGIVNDNATYIRTQLGKRVRNKMKFVPEVSFKHDNTASEAEKMDKLIGGLDIPPEEPEP